MSSISKKNTKSSGNSFLCCLGCFSTVPKAERKYREEKEKEEAFAKDIKMIV